MSAIMSEEDGGSASSGPPIKEPGSLPLPATMAVTTAGALGPRKLVYILQYLNPLFYARIAQSLIYSVLGIASSSNDSGSSEAHVAGGEEPACAWFQAMQEGDPEAEGSANQEQLVAITPQFEYLPSVHASKFRPKAPAESSESTPFSEATMWAAPLSAEPPDIAADAGAEDVQDVAAAQDSVSMEESRSITAAENSDATEPDSVSSAKTGTAKIPSIDEEPSATGPAASLQEMDDSTPVPDAAPTTSATNSDPVKLPPTAERPASSKQKRGGARGGKKGRRGKGRSKV
ncbi:hypothetical protein GQ54DRAFT_77893 [Martensiomyces pterosporus]|nr:hypothetical protein GQ54DRAFT_77893 [Martensiomyces pterosporus]